MLPELKNAAGEISFYAAVLTTICVCLIKLKELYDKYFKKDKSS